MTTVRSDASSAVLHVELPDRADRLTPGRAEQRTDLQDQLRIKAKKEVDVERTPVAAPGTQDGSGGLRPRVAARAQRHDRARRVAPAPPRRSRAGHEPAGDRCPVTDLVVERADRRVLAVEVKLSATVEDRDVVHLRWLADQLGPDLLDAVVVTTGRYVHRRRDEVAVVPAALPGP